MIRDWIRFRELFACLVARDLKVRYRGSALGFLWTFLNPILLMAVYTMIFAVFMRSPVENYPVFVFCGLLPWHWLSGALSFATGAIHQNSGIVKKVYFPTEFLPLVAVTSTMINFLLALAVLALMLMWFHVAPGLALLALPVVMVTQYVFVAAVAMVFALLNTFYRDVEQLQGVLLMIWFYVTPVVYPASMVPAQYLPWMALNPMFHVVEGYRAILVQGAMPDLAALGLTLLGSMLLFGVVLGAFNHHKFRFAEVI